ncbi:MAG: hypothetical protein QXK71_07870 [Pyrobaculum sp.]
MDAENAYRELERTCLKIECPQCRALCLDFVHAFITTYCLINECKLTMIPALERVVRLGSQLLGERRGKVVLEE